ncbi:MAG: hypothetical protein AAF957_08125 [Planctomycetota bacterium]
MTSNESDPHRDPLLRALADARFPTPSRRSLERARRIARPGPADALREAWKTLVARTAFPPSAAAVRGAGETPLLFEADGYDVDVALTSDGGLVGQVLSTGDDPALSGGTCTVVAPGHDPLLAAIDEDGSFDIGPPVPPVATIVLESEGRDGRVRVVLENVELGR